MNPASLELPTLGTSVALQCKNCGAAAVPDCTDVTVPCTASIPTSAGKTIAHKFTSTFSGPRCRACFITDLNMGFHHQYATALAGAKYMVERDCNDCGTIARPGTWADVPYGDERARVRCKRCLVARIKEAEMAEVSKTRDPAPGQRLIAARFAIEHANQTRDKVFNKIQSLLGAARAAFGENQPLA